MTTVDATVARDDRGTARVVPRTALALGMAGALGEELLAALVASPAYAVVHVGLKRPVASATVKYRPWPIGGSLIAADDAYVCLTAPGVQVPSASPVQTFTAEQLPEAAALARDAGVQRLIVVSPLSALLQLNAASHTISSTQELALVDMHFRALVIVRPTQADVDEAGGPWLARVVRAMGRAVLDIMLPSQVQALRPQTAAQAILAAVARAGDGVHVVGARELMTIVEATMPQLAPKRRALR